MRDFDRYHTPATVPENGSSSLLFTENPFAVDDVEPARNGDRTLRIPIPAARKLSLASLPLVNGLSALPPRGVCLRPVPPTGAPVAAAAVAVDVKVEGIEGVSSIPCVEKSSDCHLG